ncbi:uncharacterized protein LOC129798700 [Phlebotomus papatasi]|uniref:uncharacterized protein LOC129798700 n=1 Tax=Phlebotomus papatasi TaxID=29031 RepID=UPI002483A416|nr:uncharacterized protein LOC129798700 [Phlebotomus papatasi]
MMERLIVVFITAAAMCGVSKAAQQHYHNFAEPRADPNVKGHYSYSDPYGAIFHVTYETDKKTSTKTSPDRDLSELGTFSGKRNTQISNFNRPIYIVNTNNEDDKFEDKVSYQIASSTTKSPFKYGGFQYSSTTPSPVFNSLPNSHINKPSLANSERSSANQGGSFRPVTTKFTVNHPHPPKNQGNLISSRYQQSSYDDEEEYIETKREPTNAGQVSDKYLNDYQQALSKLQAAGSNVARRPNPPKSQIKYIGVPPNSPNSYLPKNKQQQFPALEPEAKPFKPKFKLQNVPNLYPRDDAPFKPSVGFPGGKGAPTKQKEYFEPPPEYIYTNDDVQYYNVDGGASPPSKSQSPQYLKRQNQMKFQQLAIEKMKKARNPYFGQPSQTNFRPIVPQQPPHRFSMPRRKPSRAFTPARNSYKSRPIIDGPYSIRISM